MQEDEDVLVDYNDDPEYVALHGAPPSYTPVQTPQNFDSDSEGEEVQAKREEEEAERDLEEGRKADEDIRAAELARRVKHLQEFEALSVVNRSLTIW
jgi:hypothetical protein